MAHFEPFDRRKRLHYFDYAPGYQAWRGLSSEAVKAYAVKVDYGCALMTQAGVYVIKAIRNVKSPPEVDFRHP